MLKPSNYDSTEAKTFGQFNNPPAGGYVMKVETAKEVTSKKGSPMLEIQLDFAAGEFKGYYQKLSKKLQKDCFPVYRRVFTEDAAPYLKGDINIFEKSNSGFKFNFNENSLISKLVGANMQEEEYAKNGDIKTILKIAFLCPVSEVPNQKPLPIKKLVGTEHSKSSNSFSNGEPLPENTYFGADANDENLPF